MRMDDPRFVERVRIRDREAIGKVIDNYLTQVFRVARASGLSAERAEEVTQDTFTTFVEKASSFEGRAHIKTFIFGILYNKISEVRRKFSKERQVEAIHEVMELRFSKNGKWVRPPRSLDSILFSSEIRRFIKECLDRVPEKQRLAFILREVEGLSTADICKILDVTPTNSGVLMFRARNRLRECLEARGVRGAP